MGDFWESRANKVGASSRAPKLTLPAATGAENSARSHEKQSRGRFRHDFQDNVISAGEAAGAHIAKVTDLKSPVSDGELLPITQAGELARDRVEAIIVDDEEQAVLRWREAVDQRSLQGGIVQRERTGDIQPVITINAISTGVEAADLNR